MTLSNRAGGTSTKILEILILQYDGGLLIYPGGQRRLSRARSSVLYFFYFASSIFLAASPLVDRPPHDIGRSSAGRSRSRAARKLLVPRVLLIGPPFLNGSRENSWEEKFRHFEYRNEAGGTGYELAEEPMVAMAAGMELFRRFV